MNSPLATRRRAFLALVQARWRETYRESEVIVWSLIFPVALSVGLAIAFRDRPAEMVHVAVVPGALRQETLGALESASGIVVSRLEAPAAAHALRMGHVALAVVPGDAGPTYRFDPTRPDSLLARSRVDDALQRAAGRRDALTAREERVSEPGARYIDFLIPGLLAMNIMSGGMWGVGYHLVDMRIKRLLRRLMATPMHRGDFMLSQMTLRVAFVFGEVTFLLGFARLFFGVPVRGSLGAILFVATLAALSFAGMGLAVASRAKTIEKVTGLMNLVQMPMFIASGVFFSSERFPEVVRPLIQALPLTAAVDALRALVLEGASLASQAHEVGILGAWGALGFILGLTRFRWD
jgi:ABC-type multidrug transport system permease subunit